MSGQIGGSPPNTTARYPGETEPILSVERLTQADGHSKTPNVNLSAEARKITGIEIGDPVRVNVYRNGVFIERINDD